MSANMFMLDIVIPTHQYNTICVAKDIQLEDVSCQ